MEQWFCLGIEDGWGDLLALLSGICQVYLGYGHALQTQHRMSRSILAIWWHLSWSTCTLTVDACRRGCPGPWGLRGWGGDSASGRCAFKCMTRCSAESLCGHWDVPGNCYNKGSRNNWIVLQRPHGKAAGSQLLVCCWQGDTADPRRPALH